MLPEHPELRESRKAADEVDRFRKTWITRVVSEWPIEVKELPYVILDCVRVLWRCVAKPDGQSFDVAKMLFEMGSRLSKP
jgi:hypothetical protein